MIYIYIIIMLLESWLIQGIRISNSLVDRVDSGPNKPCSQYLK